MLLIETCAMYQENNKSRPGAQRGGKGGTIPRAPNHYGGRWKVLTMSQVLFQYNTFASEKPQVRTWGAPNLLFAPGAI